MRSYGELAFVKSDQQWEISNLAPHVALRLKQVFPRLPKASTGPFRIPFNLDGSADLHWFVQRYPLKATKQDLRALKSKAKAFEQFHQDAESIRLPGASFRERAGLKPGQALRWHQKQSNDLTEHVKSLIVIDDFGLGKTYTGFGTALLDDATPMIVVMEPHLQRQWGKKADDFIDLSVHEVKGNTPYDLPEASIYLVRYSQLAPWVDVLSAGWAKSIVFDEVQNLRRGSESQKGQAARAVAQTCDYVVGLTATLIYNYGIEAFNIVEIFRPGLLGTRAEFLREWCSDDHTGKGVVKDPDALGAYLAEQNLIIRHTKSMVGQEAMQKAPILEWVDPDRKQLAADEALAESLAIRALSGEFHDSGMASREFDMRMREMTGVAKARETAAFVRMMISTGQPVLLFGYHHEVYDIWRKELADLNPLFYTGRETPTQKERAKQDFIEGRSDLLIMSVRSGAGSDGIQARCSTAVFGELDWSPKVIEQCIGRLDREGQLDPVYAIMMLTNYGSDPAMLDVLGLKDDQDRGITTPGSAPIQRQVDGDHLKRLAAEYLKSRGIPVPERKTKPEKEEAGADSQYALL